MVWFCSVCGRPRVSDQPHRCTEPDPKAPVIVLPAEREKAA